MATDQNQVERHFKPLELTADLDKCSVVRPMEKWLLFFFFIGIAARCVRYFMAFPLWEDECFIGVNIHNCSYSQLLEPLRYHQVAPILFLWMGKACTDLMGFNELALRFPAFLSSILSMLIFWRIARKTLSGSARLFAVAFFAVSYPNLRYAAEYKPYGTDMLASLLMVWFVVEWLLDRNNRRWLWALTAWSPIAIGLSFPAMFTAGGLSILLFVLLLKSKKEVGTWLCWLTFSVLFSVTLLLVYIYSIKTQMQAEMGYMSNSWNDTFPDITKPIGFLKWLVVTHAGSAFGHPVGGENFGSTLTAILAVCGLSVMFRRGYGAFAWLLCLPLLLNLFAALLHKYPYGGHVKFSMYFAPMLNLVIGIGAAWLLNGHARRASQKNTATVLKLVLGILAIIAISTSITDVLHPYKNKGDMRQRAFARWFWYNAPFASEVYCTQADLGLSFSQKTWNGELSWSAMYLCNQYIYRPGELIRDPGKLPQEARDNVYFVIYHDGRYDDFDQQAYASWLAQTSQKYDFLDKEIWPMVRNDKHERRLESVDRIEILKFRARG